jgi:hypothetical protein
MLDYPYYRCFLDVWSTKGWRVGAAWSGERHLMARNRQKTIFILRPTKAGMSFRFRTPIEITTLKATKLLKNKAEKPNMTVSQ